MNLDRWFWVFAAGWALFGVPAWFTENIFVTIIFWICAIGMVWCMIAKERKDTKDYKSYHAKKKTVLYGNEGDRMEYALSHNANPADIILATEPQRLAGLKHYPHVAVMANWTPSISDDERVYATTRTLDILKRLYERGE